MDKLRNHASVK